MSLAIVPGPVTTPLEPVDQPDRAATLDPAMRAARRMVVPRIVVWASFAAASLATLVIGGDSVIALLCLGAAGCVASALATSADEASERPLTLVAAIPAGVLLVFLWGLTAGLVGGLADISVWTNRSSALVVLGLLLLLTGTVAARRGGAITAVGRDWPALIAGLGLAGMFAWIVSSQPMALWSRTMSGGTDFLRHLGMIRDLRLAGLIEPGSASYPRAFHAAVAWLSAALGGELDTLSLWRGAQPLAFLLLTTMLVAIVALATRSTDVISRGRIAGVIAGGVAAATFVETAWFSSFLDMGAVMNLVVGVALLALLLTGITSEMKATTAALVAGGAIAVTANAWQLLIPLVSLAAMPWIARFLRHEWRLAKAWAVWGLGGLVALNGIVSVNVTVSFIATPSLSTLHHPEWWWWAALVLSLIAAAAAILCGTRTWGIAAGTATLAAVGITSYLMWASGSSWELMLYYPVKAMWTAVVVLVPLAAAGGIVLLFAIWRAADRVVRPARTALRTLALGVVILIIAVVSGRGSTTTPPLAQIVTTPENPNWSLAVIDTIAQVDMPNADGGGDPLIMGVMPSTGVQDIVLGRASTFDYMAMEALSHAGLPDTSGAPVKADLMTRNSQAICAYLGQHPDSLRITGPNPAAGPGWLMEAGCPTDVVQPERWVSLKFGSDWLGRSPWQDPSTWSYPHVADVEKASGKSYSVTLPLADGS